MLIISYQRKLSSFEYSLNPSIIENIPSLIYLISIILCFVFAATLIIVLRGVMKEKIIAKRIFVFIFCTQVIVTLFVAYILKDVEGVFFWNSPYVHKFLYVAGTISVISLLVISDWIKSAYLKNAEVRIKN
ncbi:MAG: hypothetical protein GY756_18985 [bacterium]|nr:hypothetical protein [bacterium]